MRSIDTKVGKVYYKDGVFTLEKNFKDLSLLIKEEDSIRRRVRDCAFDIVKSSWFIVDNPFYDIEKLIEDSALKIKFVYKLELEYAR